MSFPHFSFARAWRGESCCFQPGSSALHGQKEAHPSDWQEKLYKGKVVPFNSRKRLFKCMFEGDLTAYMLSWESLRSHLVPIDDITADQSHEMLEDVDDEFTVVEFLASQKRDAQSFSLSVLPIVDVPFAINEIAFDDAEVMHEMDAMDDAFTTHALTTHDTTRSAFGLSSPASIASMPLVGVLNVPPPIAKRG
ncbi:hypothetical protein L7F22_059454 [Adiantum nelumboides]|nr:hypothetical protein [Adiantum nelumboides]